MVVASFDLDQLDGDDELSRIASFAAHLCNASSAAVTIVESERQRFLASKGLDANETPRSTSFCATTMVGAQHLEVLDATQDDRFTDYELVTGEQGLRYYAGVPLISTEGAPLGSLCVIDYEPRSEPMSDLQREGLVVLGEAVKRRLQAHRHANSADFALKASAARVQFVLDSVPDIAWSAAPGLKFDFFNARWSEKTGLPHLKHVDDWREAIHPDDYAETLAKFSAAVQQAEAFEDEWRLRLADGNYRYVLSRAVPSTDDPQTARWFGTITDIDAAHRVLQERELVAGELAHRIKNIFSVIIGLVSMHSRGNKTIETFGEMLADNIRALSRAQEFALRMDDHVEEDLQGLLSLLMAPYGTANRSAVVIDGDVVQVGTRAATPLALVFHELATNSAKYGALSVPEGRLQIAVSNLGDSVEIRWQESEGPAVEKPSDTGFGSRLIRMAIDMQLGGKIEQDWAREGFRANIVIPASRLAE